MIAKSRWIQIGKTVRHDGRLAVVVGYRHYQNIPNRYRPVLRYLEDLEVGRVDAWVDPGIIPVDIPETQCSCGDIALWDDYLCHECRKEMFA